ncbi:MAG: trigger factor [Oscillospiraceae bacterium]
MSLINKKELETNKWELEFSVDGKTFKDAINVAYKKNVKKINIPGFRKGKAPQGIIEKMHGETVFFDDAIDMVLPEIYNDILEESQLIPVSRPDIDIVKADKNDGLVVKAILYTKPEISVTNYKNIEVEKSVKKVTKKDVDKEIQKVRETNSRVLTVEDREAKLDDTATIDFKGFCDGVAFDGGTGEGFDLKLGSGQFIPGFEEQIVGHKVGDEFEVNVKFPDEYHSDNLKGKDSVFEVKLHELKETQLPELDDEFAKDVSEFDTLKDYEKSIKEKLVSSNEKTSETDVENKLIDKVIENLEGEIPEIMYDNRSEEELKGFEQRIQSQGMQLDLYLQYTGMSIEGLKLTFREQAEKQVKIRLALEKVVELEKIEATEEDIAKEFEKIAEGYKISVDEVKKHINSDEIKMDIAVNKAIDLIKETSKISIVDEEIKKENATVVKKTTEKKSEEKPKKTVKATTTAKKTTKSPTKSDEK